MGPNDRTDTTVVGSKPNDYLARLDGRTDDTREPLGLGETLEGSL